KNFDRFVDRPKQLKPKSWPVNLPIKAFKNPFQQRLSDPSSGGNEFGMPCLNGDCGLLATKTNDFSKIKAIIGISSFIISLLIMKFSHSSCQLINVDSEIKYYNMIFIFFQNNCFLSNSSRTINCLDAWHHVFSLLDKCWMLGIQHLVEVQDKVERDLNHIDNGVPNSQRKN
ncbi:hypothetical protein BpHYR1_041034, partial [Brachionus plicatilis]